MAKAVKEYAGCYIVKKCLNGEWHYKIGYKGKTETNRLDKYNVRDIICLGFIFGEPNEKDKFPNWSFKHGRKEAGKNGQFNIRKSNVQWHLTHTFKQKITWAEAYKIWESIKI